MTEEVGKQLKQHLKNRTYIDAPLYDVAKILEKSGTQIWAKQCSDRIADAGLLDGKHVLFDFVETGHVLVDAIGVTKCEDILKHYISDEDYEDLEYFVWRMRDCTRNKNQILKVFMSNSKEVLSEMCTELQETEADASIYLELLRIELHCRRPYMRVYLRIKKWAADKIFRFKNYRMVRLLKQTLKEVQKQGIPGAVQEHQGDSRPDKGQIIEDAYNRFIQNHGDVSGLKGDDLKKFIYLGVNYFGAKKWSGKYRPISGDDAEMRYLQIRQVMLAVGRLTPLELLQMFPVIKSYDGEKYEEKDYFYTMNRLNGLNQYEPIGGEQQAAKLLWDYDNNDLKFFVLRWLGCIDDLHLYAGISGPYNEFYGLNEEG